MELVKPTNVMLEELKKQDIYYVYVHVDPETGVVMYVGMGSLERAWTIRPRTYNNSHLLWLYEQMNKGYLPNDWVAIEFKGLTRAEALANEQLLIKQLGPKFNCTNSWSAKKYSEEEIKIWIKLRAESKTFKAISDERKVSPMVVMRALNGTTHAYKHLTTGRK